MIRRADLHLHTKFSAWKHLRLIKPRDSYSEPIDVYETALARGMDFVAITDHDTIDGALDLLARRPEIEPRVIVGEEVETRFPETGQWVHVNVFDIDESDHDDIVRLRGDVRELVRHLRARGIFHVLNHPFQSYKRQMPGRAYMDEIVDLFTHFEVANCTLPRSHDRLVAEMVEHASRLIGSRHGIGASDAHELRDVARAWTEVDMPEAGSGVATKEQWLAAVASGAGVAAGAHVGAMHLTGNVYRIIGRYYKSLLDPDVRKDMATENYLGAGLLAPACMVGTPAVVTLGNSLRIEIMTAYLRWCLRAKVEPEARVTVSPEALVAGELAQAHQGVRPAAHEE